jgi:hypothetical protein
MLALSILLGVLAGFLAVRVEKLGIGILGGFSGAIVGLLLCNTF